MGSEIRMHKQYSGVFRASDISRGRGAAKFR